MNYESVYRTAPATPGLSNIGDNFHRQYKENIFCPLSCENTIDSQEHLLVCIGIKKHMSIEHLELMVKTKYEHIFGDPTDQFEAAEDFQLVLR